MKLEHVAINVPAPTDMANWWAENLSAEIVVQTDKPPYMHFICDSARASMIELYHNTTAPVPDYESMSPYTLHFAFASDNIEADHARLLAAGATTIGDISTNAAGDKLCFLRDPWGVTVQLVQRIQPML